MDFSEFRIIATIIRFANLLANIIVGGVNFTVEAVARINRVVIDTLTGEIRALGVDLEGTELAIINEIADQTGLLTDLSNASTRVITDAILDGTTAAKVESERSTAQIIGTLSGAIAAGATATQDATQILVAPIAAGVESNTGLLGRLTNLVGDGLRSVGGLVRGVLDILGDGISTTIINNINLDRSIFGTVAEVVRETVADTNRTNAGVLKTITDLLGGLLLAEVAARHADVLIFLPEIKRIWQAILKAGADQTVISEKTTDASAEGFGGTTIESIINKTLPGLELSGKNLRKSFVDWINVEDNVECLDPDTRNLIIAGIPIESWWDEMINSMINALGLIMAALALGQARAQVAVFDWQACNPNQPLPPSETVLAFQRRLIGEDKAELNLRKQGWSAEDAELIINTGFTAPDLALVYAMWLRDEIDDSGLDLLLRRLGYDDAMLAPLKKLAFFIPPVQDLITMAVREVFTPEIAQAQGQFEDFPEDFAEFAKQQGVSRQWALNYWAAHWSLPSVQMGFEMLHRGVIDQDQLETLMRALDIMPFWRQPLIDISFTPFTRIDIRRMHRLGVLTEAQVLRSYKDIGYDDEKAAKQLEFVLAANAEDEIITLDIASDLTRSSILGFYADGIIRRSSAAALLIQAGVNVAAAELFLLSADFDIERRERKLAVSLVLDRFRFAGQSFTESADQIRGLDLASRERELALFDLESLDQQLTKLPSKADLDKFLGADIIDSAEYVDQLERQGIPLLWADRYLALAQKG